MNGKRKGSAFERAICKQLSLWVTAGKMQDCFWRSAMSGGRATVQARRGTKIRQAGDITAVSPEGQSLTDYWFVECKHVRKLRLSSFLLTNTGPLALFWKKACKQAKEHGREPMIIARENGQPTIVVVRAGTNLLEPQKIKTAQYVILLWDEVRRTQYKPAIALGRGQHEFAVDPAGTTNARSRRARARQRKADARAVSEPDDHEDFFYNG